MSACAVPTKPLAVSPDDLRQLHRAYDLRNPDEIVLFLSEYPTLVPLLIESRRQIDHYFADGVPVSLSLERDPEESNQELSAVIVSGLPIQEAHERLYRFWNEWWDKQTPSLSWLIFFGTL